ncbi:Protein IDA [Euphorbia peplus]|nr:Protein IDA [Euphorbia peplus]
MAAKHHFMAILFFFLFFAVCSFCCGATYRVHNIKNHRQTNEIIHVIPPITFSLLPKGAPIPPSGPSKRHNEIPNGNSFSPVKKVRKVHP